MLMDPKWQEQLDHIVEAKSPDKTEPWRVMLLKAADHIEDHGWCQHVLFNDGRVCAVGALLAATGRPPESWRNIWYELRPLIQESRTKLAQFLGLNSIDVTSIPHWNNDPSRTKEEVIAAMRDAAKGE